MSAKLVVSLTTFATILCIVVTLTITKSMTSGSFSKVNYSSPEFALIILLSLAIVAMGALSCLTVQPAQYNHHGHVQLYGSVTPTQQVWQLWLRRNLKLCGIVPFFLFGSFLLIAYSVAESNCIPVWNECCEGGNHVFHYIEVIFHAVSILFMLTATVFCSKFRQVHFLGHVGSLMCLALLLAATLSFWFYSLFSESFTEAVHDSNGLQKLLEICPGLNLSSLQTTETDDDLHSGGHCKNVTYLRNCFNESTDEFQFARKATPYLHPFTVEFLTMLAECVASWLFLSASRAASSPLSVAAVGKRTSSSGISVSSNETRAALTADASNLSQTGSMQDYGSFTPRHRNSTTSNSRLATPFRPSSSVGLGSASLATGRSTSPTDDDNSSSRSTESTRITQTLGSRFRRACDADTFYILSVIGFAIASIVLLVAGILQVHSDTIQDRNAFALEKCRLAYWILLIVCNVVGVAVSWNSSRPPLSDSSQSLLRETETETVTDTVDSADEGFEWFEWFIVVCQLGPMFKMSFSLIAAYGNVVDDRLLPLFTAEDVIGFLQLFLQTPFYFYAKGVRFDFSRSRRDASCQLRKAMVFEAVLMCFVLSNLTFWIQNTFILPMDIRNASDSGLYRNDWTSIIYVFNPLSLMYSFNSILLYISLLLEQKYRRTRATNSYH